MNNQPTPEQIELFKRDSDGDGIPDIVTNPDEILDQVTMPDGKPLGAMQKKIIKSMIAGMGKENVVSFLEQMATGGKMAASHIKQETSAPTSAPSVGHRAPVNSVTKAKRAEWLRIFFIVDAIIIIGALYIIFGR